MSGKKQRAIRNHQRQAENLNEELDPLSEIHAKIPDSDHRKLKIEAQKRGVPVGEIVRERLGVEQPKVVRGVDPEEAAYNRMSFQTIVPADVPNLPIDKRNVYGQRQIFKCLGGRFRRGIEVYPMAGPNNDHYGSHTLLLFDETGEGQNGYHFPILDQPGREHRLVARRFDEICKVFKPLTEKERRAHPLRSEWRELRRALYNSESGSVTQLLVKLIWQEYCYSVLRSLGHPTPQSLVTRGLYDEVHKGHAAWMKPGTVYEVPVGQNVLPYEFIRYEES